MSLKYIYIFGQENTFKQYQISWILVQYKKEYTKNQVTAIVVFKFQESKPKYALCGLPARTEHLETSSEEVKDQCGRTDEKVRPQELTDQFLRKMRTHSWSVRPHGSLKGSNSKGNCLRAVAQWSHSGRTKAAQSSESQFLGGLSIFGRPVHVPGLKLDHGIMGDVHREVNWQNPRPYKPRKEWKKVSQSHTIPSSTQLNTLFSTQTLGEILRNRGGTSTRTQRKQEIITGDWCVPSL